ncbi:hypothetical protein STTU_1073 [Streptomyces sp. Tu6071]|nr:hypothetical protein STTU_1073 [Streptomyces sp. Tu6071]
MRRTADGGCPARTGVPPVRAGPSDGAGPRHSRTGPDSWREPPFRRTPSAWCPAGRAAEI